jgi:hypothetical protein
MSYPKCPMRHKRQGIVTTHPNGLPAIGEGHYAASCCGKPECVQELAGEAYQVTGTLGVYLTDAEARNIGKGSA